MFAEQRVVFPQLAPQPVDILSCPLRPRHVSYVPPGWESGKWENALNCSIASVRTGLIFGREEGPEKLGFGIVVEVFDQAVFR
jgi:hypothetical protein